ncbi:MAG: hypothetical protein Fur0018_13720 [Anaerolineales bacterium]
MEEPTVLDYVKSKLFFWRAERLHLPETEPEIQDAPPAEPAAVESHPWRAVPWASFAALLLAILGQLAFEPPDRSWKGGLAFYAGALGLLALARRRGEWRLPNLPHPFPLRGRGEGVGDGARVRARPFLAALVLLLVAFIAFGGNQFTAFNVYIWLLGLAFLVTAFWERDSDRSAWWRRFFETLRRPWWEFRLRRAHLLWLALFVLAAWFRFYRLGSVPPEMVSDHAEKLWDVWDVLHGQTRIFFPRNTGREFFQMYLTAAVILLFRTGYSFLSLKIGTAFMGLFTLPWIYLLGKELGNRRAGLLAMAFAGVAYWPNVIARAALRFTLYPAFTAPVLYYLVRGLRHRRRNDFIRAGLWLGLGLHGYSPMRFVPFVVAAAVGVYLLHRAAQGGRVQAAWGFVLTGLFSFAVFLPLFRYMLQYPEMVSYRALTRLTSLEHPLPGAPLQIFFSNLGKALAMFAWDNGNIWVHSLPGRPALGFTAAALFHLGIVLLLVRYLRERHWEDLFVLLSIPLLMMPSILSLAFPAENPSLNRTGGALIPVFLVVGFALEGLLHTLEGRLSPKAGRRAALGVAALLLGVSALQNYAIVFVQYNDLYRQSSWNTSEMGAVVRGFIESGGNPENAWTVAYPYWVDTRLVGINAGLPFRDTQIWPEQIEGTRPLQGNKLFLVKPDDLDGQETLERVYPEGVWQMHVSAVEGKDFLLYWVPAHPADAPSPPPAEEENFPPYPTPTVPPEP